MGTGVTPCLWSPTNPEATFPLRQAKCAIVFEIVPDLSPGDSSPDQLAMPTVTETGRRDKVFDR